jgi:hypothetical protein
LADLAHFVGLGLAITTGLEVEKTRAIGLRENMVAALDAEAESHSQQQRHQVGKAKIMVGLARKNPGLGFLGLVHRENVR